MENKKILLGLTTTPDSDWHKKIKEIEKLRLTEVALFLTGISREKRKELFDLLEKTGLNHIPHVHLRDDMDLDEIIYLEKKYSTKVFNLHTSKDPHPIIKSKDCIEFYGKKIFLENTDYTPTEDELINFGGICIDFSHWQDQILQNKSGYDKEMKLLTKKFHVGCSHISGVGSELIESSDLQLAEIRYKNFSKHYFNNLNEFDYIKKYLHYLPNLISLELTNSFEQQLKVKEYLEKIINS